MVTDSGKSSLIGSVCGSPYTVAEVLKIKDNVRDLFNVGKHSIHITDTKEEAIRVARVVFSDNSIHFLNYAKPNRYISTHKKIDKFKKFMIQKDIYANKLVLDGGIILSAYGLRECGDIEYFVDDKKMLMRDNGDRLDLIYNPKNYFYFNDLKFISFGRLYKMKINRNEKTDKNDCKMMEALIESNTFKTIINKHKQKYFYFKIFMREKIIYLLKLVGVFEILKKLIKG